MRIFKLITVCIGLISFCLIYATQSNAKIDPKTAVGAWLFDEGVGNVVNDSSGKGNDGKILGGATPGDGKFKKGLQLNGKDGYVEVADSATISIAGPLTVMAWFKFGKEDVNNINRLVSKYGSPNGNYLLQFYSTAGEPYTIQFGMWDKATGWDIKARVVHANWKLDQDRIKDWHHFAGTWDGKVIKLYIDGKQVESKDYAGPIQTLNVPVYIGRGGTEYAFGIIDETAIFSSALADTDVLSIMNTGLEQALGIVAVESADKLPITWSFIKDR